MLLREFLKHHRKYFFANIVGVSKQSVYAWLRGDYFPSKKMIQRIEEITDGLVTADDFYRQWKELEAEKLKAKEKEREADDNSSASLPSVAASS